MTTPLWMPLYVADYLADTGHLRTIEHGAYLMLIMHYWQNGGLPDDDSKLARIARMSGKEWAAARDTLAALFGSGWRHGRIETELAKAAAYIERQKTNGRKGGRPRNPRDNPNKTQQEPTHNPRDNPNKTQQEPTHNPPANPNKTKSQPQPPSDPEGSAARPRDVASVVFSAGLAWLRENTGKTDENCRRLLGKWRRDHGDEALISVLGAAQREAPLDAVAWIERAFRQRAAYQPGGDNPYASVPG